MNTLIICPEYFDGRLNGIGRVSEAISKTLSEISLSTTVWSANEDEGSVELPFGRSFGRNYLKMILVAGVLPPKGINMVGAMHLGLSPIARLCAWRRRCPYFVFFHGIEAWKPVRARSRWGIRGASVLLFNSRTTQLRFCKFNPSLANLPSKVVELAVAEPVCSLGSADRSFHILCVGRMTKSTLKKNIRLLIDAVAEVGAICPKVCLVVVGDGDDRQDLQLYAKARLRSEQYLFTGRISDDEVAQWRSRSAVFALPSEQEGFGVVLAEAMAAGLPCVCGSTDAASEVVQNGVTGFCVHPRKPKELVAALLQILTDQALWNRMSIAARSRYLEHYTIPAFQKRFKTALKEYGLLS